MKDELLSWKSTVRWGLFIALVAASIPFLIPLVADHSVGMCYKILGLAVAQNVSFSIVSRSRNRNDMRYHMVASIFSNGIWYLTFRELVQSEMNFVLFIPYTVGTMTGSIWGAKISMVIERWLGAASDNHIEKKASVTDLLDQRLSALERRCRLI